ncbi:MAG: hypothetical protein LBT40_01860 [Deltaproteobacteria bacterium]|jgi:hypothetical protein|nr:hypothetical protein [Deltaproteobacteria bacterium]
MVRKGPAPDPAPPPAQEPAYRKVPVSPSDAHSRDLTARKAKAGSGGGGKPAASGSSGKKAASEAPGRQAEASEVSERKAASGASGKKAASEAPGRQAETSEVSEKKAASGSSGKKAASGEPREDPHAGPTPARTSVGKASSVKGTGGTVPKGPSARKSGGRHGRSAHGGAHPCLDPESGFYREEHFELSLRYEMNRTLEAEKPLGLLLVSFEGGLPGFFAGFLQERLRRIDLPSRLGRGEAAVIMPRVNPSRAGRLVERLGADLAADGRMGGAGMPLFGAALAWPNDTVTPEGLLARARESLDTAAATSERLMSGRGPYAEAETELVAEEKETLFAGFSLLRGPDPSGGEGPGS